MSNLQTRIITAIVLGAAALWLTWIGGLGFTLFSIAIGLAMFHEWTSLSAPKQTLFSRVFGWGWLVLTSILLVMDRSALLTIGVLIAGTLILLLIQWRAGARLAGGRTILCGFLRRFAFAPARRRTFRLYSHCFSFRCGLVHRYRSLLQRSGIGWAEVGAALLAEQDVVRRHRWRRCRGGRWHPGCLSGGGSRQLVCTAARAPAVYRIADRRSRGILGEAPVRRKGFRASVAGTWRCIGPC